MSINLVTGTILYILIWWTVVFCVLPWGNPKNAKPMSAVAAPNENSRLPLKFLITTGISAVVWLIIYALAAFGIFDLYAIIENAHI